MFLALLVCTLSTLPNKVDAQGDDSTCAAAASGVMRSVTIIADGRRRNYLIHTPRTVGVRLPIVFAFHGRGQTPELLERYSGLSRLHAVLVLPRGLPGRGGKLSWSGTPTAEAGVDDVSFVRSILTRLRTAACADGARVYATGKSDGGGLAAQLACENIAAAVAPVAGAYYQAAGCNPTRAVAVLEFHGTDDRIIPYRGSERRGLPNVHAWLTAWATRDGCTNDARPRTVAENVLLHRWTGCREDSTVEGYRIDGGGHTWPGARYPSGPGSTTQAIDATSLIGRFFGIALDTS